MQMYISGFNLSDTDLHRIIFHKMEENEIYGRDKKWTEKSVWVREQ